VTERTPVATNPTEPTKVCVADTESVELPVKVTLADVILKLEEVRLGSALSEIEPKALS